ncbi:hypothetical protein GGS21DRAFT_389701 [Xylaria nigripes]|nr:hypothetical protein GGS21DRAFT_389701 [Xylaria nigripes]
MSDARGMDGFRAKPQANLKGLNVDTTFTQPAANSENESIPVGASSNGKQAMLVGHRNQEFRDRAKWKGLTIDTKLTRDAHGVEKPSTNITAKWRASNANVPRLSEAMMNRDWRNHRRSPQEDSPSVMDPLWSAPPEQSKFPDNFKVKPHRHDEHETIDYDHGLERAAYRCRRPHEVKPELVPFTKSESIDAELCLSAPATKLEFSEAEIGGDERSRKYDPSVFQPSTKSIVRLDKMAPANRAGYEKIINWDEQLGRLGRNSHERLQESSSFTAVTPVDLSMSWESVEFPYAEIRAVKGDKKFETGLSDVEETIRMQLSTLVEPQTAGLPPAYLRKEYEERREERRKAAALVNSTAGPHDGQDCADTNHVIPAMNNTNDVQFNALLGRLNKLCAPRLRAYTVGDKKDSRSPTPKTRTENAEIDNVERSPSRDSAISGMSSRGRQRSSTLNPEAVEFHVTTEKKRIPVVDKSGPAITSPNMAANAAKASPEKEDPILKLETRVAELEAQLARQHSKDVQSARQRSANAGRAKKVSHGPSFVGTQGGRKHVMNNGTQGSVGYQTAQPIPPYQSQPGFAMAPGVMPMPLSTLPNTVNYGLTANNVGFPLNGMPSGINNPYNAAQVSAVPFQGQGNVAATGPCAGTSLWVKSVFGPKPVSKPNRPFQPGDGVQAMRQQQYEEYLEHLRATDPAYAQRCKQRQARRADRQRLNNNDSMRHQLFC